jgi:hypothetical protein
MIRRQSVNNNFTRSQSRPFVSTALRAGLAGGIAEMIWIAGYCALTPLRSAELLRQISLSVGINAGAGAFASMFGLAIHLGLSILLGLTFALTVWRPSLQRSGVAGNLLASCAVLSAVWVFNFFVVLPGLNPGFADLMPYAVTLVSKLLFGIAMGWVLYRGEHRAHSNVASPALANCEAC